MIQDILSKLNNILWGYPFIAVLLFLSLYLSIKLKFPQLKIIATIKDIFKSSDKGNDKMTSFKALTSVLSGTLGTGNITGVATAIAIGGVGSLFWMFLSGIFAMVISYAENYIVLKHRKHDKWNGYYGGTMYVLDEVLDKRKLALLFAVMVIISAICTGTMVQSNSLSTLLYSGYKFNQKLVGIILAIITMYVIFGGKKRIAKISSIVIPACTLTYIILCVSIIVVNKGNFLPGLKYILSSAFSLRQIAGGVIGTTLSQTIGKGFAIGMFSNEAGMGSAPIFTATVEEKNIDTQAKIAATSVVIDTVLLCTLTGLTIVSTEFYNIASPSAMLSKVFNCIPYGNFILNICMIFFVISTIPCWAYYGEQAIKYIFKTNLPIYLFRILYVIGVYVGSIVTIGVVWDLAGISNALMTLPNIYMIYKCFKIDLHL